ncbi:hypothetical protein H5T87_01865 [bacterium]|nr:hypothetical protein [bacterium]
MEEILLESARQSANFAHICLEDCPLCRGRRAISSFVDFNGTPMLWHDFGPLEGPGWASNSLGGAYELLLFSQEVGNGIYERDALGLLHHSLNCGFLREDGFIIPYRHLLRNELCLNFKGHNDWFAPGSMARIALQMLWLSDVSGKDLSHYALKCALWLKENLEMAPNGWYPRRCYPDGKFYPFKAEEKIEDPISEISGDGSHILFLFAELSLRGAGDFRKEIERKTELYLKNGGFLGSLNHDTYDKEENVSIAVGFRMLLRVAKLLEREDMRDFAFGLLKRLERFELKEDLNGCATTGLLYMEDSWTTCYLWENAEAALAYIEAYKETGEQFFLNKGRNILLACSRHHYGELGFLTEGVDWQNSVGAQHHIDGKEFGDIKYTEPLLNNLHIIEPTIKLKEVCEL